jgi:hypothetical protein
MLGYGFDAVYSGVVSALNWGFEFGGAVSLVISVLDTADAICTDWLWAVDLAVV